MSNPLRRALADTSRERLLRAASIALATLLLALSVNVAVAAHAMYEGVLTRDAARQMTYFIDPTETDELGNPAELDTPPIAKIAIQDDRAGWDLVTIVTLAVIDPSAPPPPGLTHWPEPGQVFASQALVDDAEGPALIGAYGSLAGTIATDALSLPTDLVAWVGADVDRMSPTALGIPSFGRAPVSVDGSGDGPGYASFYSAVAMMVPISAWRVLVAFFLVAPSLVYLFVSLRLGAERRASRLAVLRALGASPRHVRAAILAELAPPVAVGAGAALLVSLAGTAATWRLPVLDAAVVGKDLRAHIGWLTLGPAFAALAASIIMLWADRQLRSSAPATRPVSSAPKERSWPVVVLAASVFVANYGYAHFDAAGRPDVGVLVVLACGAAGALSASFLTSLIVRRLGALLVYLARRRPKASALLVAGRELMTLTRPVVRATAAISIASLVVVHVWALVTISSTEERNARGAFDANGGLTATVRVANSDTNLPLVAEHLPAGVVLLQVSDGGGIVHATCADLEAVFGTCAAGSPLEPRVSQVSMYVETTAHVDVLDAAGTLTSADAPFDSLLVSTTGVTLPVDHLAARFRADVSPFVEINQPGEGWLVSATFALNQSRWYVAGAVLGLLVVVLTASATMTFEVVRASRRFAALGTLEGRGQFYVLLGGGAVGLPVLSAALSGLAIGLAQIGALVGLDTRLGFPWGMTAATTLFGVAVAILGSVVTAFVTRRAASSWQSRVEE